MCASRAVLWDMDGTLIDSEDLHWLAWRDTMANEGIAITHEQFIASFGQRNDAIIPNWLGAATTPERIRRVEIAKEEHFRSLVRDRGILPSPGVASWLHKLNQQGWLQAIASSAPRANVEAVLETLGTASYFQSIVSAEDVHRGKPDPEVFLLAASRFGLPPDRCIVVEDAVAGIEAARRAGMRSIGINRSGTLAADVAATSFDLLHTDVFETLLQQS